MWSCGECLLSNSAISKIADISSGCASTMLFFFLVVLAPLVALGQINFDGPALYQVTDPVQHGECPTWDGRTNMLFYVDIHKGDIYSYNYDTKEINSLNVGGEVAPIIQSKNNPEAFIVGVDKSVYSLFWDGRNNSENLLAYLTAVDGDKPTRMNDGKADKEGRVWFGTMALDAAEGQGTLYKIERDPTGEERVISTPMITPVTISNGMAWNSANDKVYYIDSPTLQIAEYDYDNALGTISNRRVAFDLHDHDLNADPDGMTIDKDDNLWVALYGGGSVIKVNPITGELLQRIAIPAESVTSVMWGGPDLDVLFVTTSRVDLSDEQIMKQPAAGAVFALTNLGTSGVPVFGADLIGDE